MQRRALFKKSLAYLFVFLTVKSFAKEEKGIDMDVQLIITFQIKKEKLDSFMELVKDVKKNLPKVDGCKGVQVFQVHGDKHIIRFIETWENIDKHKKHIKHVVDSGDWPYIASHLVDEPISQYFHEV